MRTREEINEAFKKIAEANPDGDNEELNVIYDTLRWCDGYDWDNTIALYLPD